MTTGNTPGSTAGGTGGAAALAELCRRAEAAGAGALWSVDHLFWPGPMLECLTTLAVAATTTTVPIGTCVLQLPLRRPAAVARQAATLQALSGGRLVLGVGLGTHPGEYAAAGAAWAGRGRALDEGIDALRRAWARSGPGVDYPMAPPVPPVPVWVGGSSDAALGRAAARGDGWVPLFVPPERYAADLVRLDALAEAAGRDPGDVARAVVLFCSVGEGRAAAERGAAWLASLYALPARAFARHLVAGPPAACAEAVDRYLEAGAEHVAVMVADDRAVEAFAALRAEVRTPVAARQLEGVGR